VNVLLYSSIDKQTSALDSRIWRNDNRKTRIQQRDWTVLMIGIVSADRQDELYQLPHMGCTGWIRGKKSVTMAPLCIILLFLLFVAPPAFSTQEKEETIQIAEHLSIAIKTERMIDSHTSYEFGYPFSPYQAPLSRLEFPLDSWWGGAELRAIFPRFSFGLEVLTNMSQEADGGMRDSDWDDEDNPDLKTIYSESKCRLEQSYVLNADVDMKISDWLGLPKWLDLRPVAGFRWQNFNFVTHDGIQFELGEPPLLLHGDGISFEQTYAQYFVGMRAALDMGRRLKLKSLAMLAQFDWAYVEGHNKDHHLLREGIRYTFEDTTGHAWHGSIGLKAGLLKQFSIGLEADFLSISTEGSHRLVNPPFDIDLTWSNGVEVWSYQNRIALMLQYVF